MASQLFHDQGVYDLDCTANNLKDLLLGQTASHRLCPLVLFVVNPWRPLVGGFQPTDVVRVTVTETCFASGRTNFRSSTVIFRTANFPSRCDASRSAKVSIKFTD